MRYQSRKDKSKAGDIVFIIFYVLLIAGMLAFGIWYQWLDISAKLAIKDMAKQQQQQEVSHDN